MKSPVNIYDFDHTIYDGDASFDFILYCLLRHPKTWRFLPIQFLAAVRYALRQWDRKQVKQAAFALLSALPDGASEVESFWNTHDHKIKPWYMKQKQATDLIISASPEFLLKPIAQRLGIEPPIATIMDIQTGKISGENCRAGEKVKRLRMYDPSVIVASCYSDSMSDIPLLRLAEKAYLVKRGTVVALGHDTIG
jgi:HAD superfamily phosphoserine phosphatase-like hydrolase